MVAGARVCTVNRHGAEAYIVDGVEAYVRAISRGLNGIEEHSNSYPPIPHVMDELYYEILMTCCAEAISSSVLLTNPLQLPTTMIFFLL